MSNITNEITSFIRMLSPLTVGGSASCCKTGDVANMTTFTNVFFGCKGAVVGERVVPILLMLKKSKVFGFRIVARLLRLLQFRPQLQNNTLARSAAAHEL
nr:hypothetical protein [Tanacetum cinerariifolium]